MLPKFSPYRNDEFSLHRKSYTTEIKVDYSTTFLKAYFGETFKQQPKKWEYIAKLWVSTRSLGIQFKPLDWMIWRLVLYLILFCNPLVFVKLHLSAVFWKAIIVARYQFIQGTFLPCLPKGSYVPFLSVSLNYNLWAVSLLWFCVQGIHVRFCARTDEDVEEKVILDKVAKSSGAESS